MSNTPEPWDYVPSTENHGPYITSDHGSTICDLYVMSQPDKLSIRNGGPSRPIPFLAEMADLNAKRIVNCVNAMAGIDDPVGTMTEIRAAIAPIKHYVQMRHEKPLRSMGDDIHGIHANSEWEAVLKLSHLEVIAALLSRIGDA